MKYTRISANSGLKVSHICLSMWHLPKLVRRTSMGSIGSMWIR